MFVINALSFINGCQGAFAFKGGVCHVNMLNKLDVYRTLYIQRN